MADREAPLTQQTNTTRYSFVPGEVITAGTRLSLRFAKKIDIDAEYVQHAIAVHQRRQQCKAHVILDDDGKTIHVSTDSLQPGSHQVEIGHLCDTAGQTVCESTSIPVTIGGIKGKVPDHLRVEHVVYGALHDFGCKRLKPGAAPPEDCEYLQIVKCVDRKSCRVEHLAFDKDGNQVDSNTRFAAITKRRQDVFGCLHPALKHLLDQSRDTQPLDVIVIPRLSTCAELAAKWIKPNDKHIAERPKYEQEYFEKVKDAWSSALSELGDAAVVKEVASDADPFVAYFIHARLTVKQLKQVTHSQSIGAIFLKDNSMALDLANSMAISRANQAQAPPLGYTGSGVNVAVYEDGPSDQSQLQFAGQYLTFPEASDHARLTSGIIKNTQTTGPKGFAPNCSLYSANTRDVTAVDWAVRTMGCTVVSQSFHRVAGLDPFDEQAVGTLSFDDVLKDWLALHWPFPTIVHAAGNDTPNLEYVNHKGFNTISVGSHTDDAKLMVASSVFKNPVSPHMDRELPEITANGDNVTAVGETNSGTSFAAPAVAGVVAVMQEADTVLKSWPEGCRAILFASADRNIKGGTWWSDVSNDVDAWDGAGALNAEGACQIARARQSAGNTATSFGWNAWTLMSSELGSDTLSKARYKVVVPNSPLLLWRYTVKVALAFSSAIFPDAIVPVWGGTTETSDLNINLDLIVRDSAGNQVANSSSFDNSYEIVEFPGRRGETYEIIIRRNEGTRNVFVGLAWGVWGRLNVLSPIPVPDTNPLPSFPRPRPQPPIPLRRPPVPDPPPFARSAPGT